MRTNPLLYQSFPVEIRRFYGDVAQERDRRGRHTGLLNFTELALVHLASLSLSDYRSRCLAPDLKVESFIDRTAGRKLTLGTVLELFRLCARALPDPLIPGPRSFPDLETENLARFVAAMDAVEAAVAGQRPGFRAAEIDVVFHVDRALESDIAPVDWWTGWNRLVEYRNKVTHSNDSRWPILDDEFWEVMTPLLHDAVVDLLTSSVAAEAVLAHPVASLTLVTTDESGPFSYAVCGEDRGIWFDEEIVTAKAVTERWQDACWKPTTASSFVLDSLPDGWAVRGLFWDLRNGLPPKMELTETSGEPGSTARATTPLPRHSVAAEGRGVAPGTCGEFAQGILLDGTPFHVTCPVNKSATVVARVRSAAELSVAGLSPHHRKLGLAIENAARSFDLGSVEISVRHWSDIDIGKGMGSSTADVLAGIRAVAGAAGERLSPEAEGGLAAAIESSDGSMYPGIVAVNHRTCELVRAWDWYPQFAIVMLIPHDSVDTHSIPFGGQTRLAGEYETLLERMDTAISSRSIATFAEQSTRSAVLNNRFLLNPYCSNLCDRLDDFDALGVNVGHTGTVCGLLFENSEEGRIKAGEACFKIRRSFPGLKDVKVVTTPYCASGSGEESPEADDSGEPKKAGN